MQICCCCAAHSMISDRYIPDDADDYDLAQTRGPSHPRSSREERDHGKQQQLHRSGSSHNNHHKKSRESRHRGASVEDVEDGEIVDAEASHAAAEAADRRGDGEGGLSLPAAAANGGRHRYPADDPGHDKPAAQDR